MLQLDALEIQTQQRVERLLAEAEHDRLTAACAAPKRTLRAQLAALLHALAQRLEEPTPGIQYAVSRAERGA